MSEPYQGNEPEKINMGLARVYCILFTVTLSIIISSIISSESRPHFEMRLRQQEGLVVCTNNALAASLDCQIESSSSSSLNLQGQLEDAEVVREYNLDLPRKTAVEGLDFIPGRRGAKTAIYSKDHLLLSTGSYGGSLNVLELDDDRAEWTQISRIEVPPSYFGTGVTTIGEHTYLLTWKSR